MRREPDVDETDTADTVCDAGRDARGDAEPSEPSAWRRPVMARRMQGEHDDELQPGGGDTCCEKAAPARRATEQAALNDRGDRDPDAELVARVGARDASAVRVLVARKLPRLLALATRMLGDRNEAEDVAQETFLRIWNQAPRWREGEARFDTWLHRVVLNLCYDRLRGRREEPVDTLPDVPDTQPEPAAHAELRSRDARVRQALAALPPRQREALVLQYYQEMSNVEAANLMGITVDALESLLARARRNLRAQLAGDPPSEDKR
ncbi:RNA polymerase sigma factor [Burkholderia cenocepacia]|uniref:RNA polymerase sigma factor n=1 Tax=Burkholderia cenocepacia TaxID=95486 RepID=UPI00158CD8F4|nr:RNA polymerase sigma factor [Burkholderia cenocepacia]MBN3566716.1 RNA polymerase sigma factor [Burkholderia cenocepacia]MBR7954007.1 RNA polymerase sigma factor [Burkholderia cenocepacia]MBR8110178.1 RNA polymerase sigma factor [Burkholderia cenocepacia]MBR8375856.1 RNA polymerase sigma factor [Burkholderia cenocepacia]